MRRVIALSLFAFILLFSVGCGSSDNGSEGSDTPGPTDEPAAAPAEEARELDTPSKASEADYVTAFTKGMGVGAGANVNLPAAAAKCVAPKWVVAIGLDQLRTQVEPADVEDPSFELGELQLDGSAAEDAAQAFRLCEIDLVHEFVSGLGKADADVECLAGNLDEEAFYAAVAHDYEGTDAMGEFGDLYAAAAAKCQLSEG